MAALDVSSNRPDGAACGGAGEEASLGGRISAQSPGAEATAQLKEGSLAVSMAKTPSRAHSEKHDSYKTPNSAAQYAVEDGMGSTPASLRRRKEPTPPERTHARDDEAAAGNSPPGGNSLQSNDSGDEKRAGPAARGSLLRFLANAGRQKTQRQQEQQEQPDLERERALASARSLAFKRSIYTFVQGGADLSDPPRVFLRKVMSHHLIFVLYAFALSALMLPIVYMHVYMAGFFSARAEEVGATTLERTQHLGEPRMFDPSNDFFWRWVGLYSASALSTILSVIYLWVAVVTRFHRSRCSAVALIGWFAIYPCYVAAVYWLSWASDTTVKQTVFIVPSFLAGCITIYFVGRSVRKYLRFERFGLYIALQTLVQASVFTLYIGQLPSWFLGTSSHWERIFIRLVVHPVLFEVAHATNRIAVMLYPNHLSEKRLCVFVLPAYVESNLLGRFLVASMPTVTGAVVLSVLLGAQELLLRVTTPLRDYLYCRLMFGVEKASTMAFSDAVRRVKADILNIDLQCEFFGILVAPFLLAGYKLTLIAAEEGNAPEQDLTTGSILQSQLMSAILQVSIELIVDLTPALLVVALHKRHSTAGLEDIGPPIPRDADVDSVEAVDSAEVQDELAGVKAKPGGRDLESGGSFIVGVSPKRHPICPVNGEALVAPVIAVDPGTPKPGDAERSPVGSSSWDGSGPDSPVQAINQATDLDNMRQNSAGELIHALVTSSDHAGAGRGHVTDDSDARSGEGFEGKTGSPSPARVPGRIQSPQPHRSRTRRKRRGSVARGGRSRTRRGSFLESMFVGASELQPLSMDSTGNFDDKDLGLHPDASTAPESLWQELSHIRVITTLKANVVCSLNCWDQRFDHYFLVVMAFVVGWSTYFLRSFFYVGSVMCSQRDDHGDWEWFVCGTH